MSFKRVLKTVLLVILGLFVAVILYFFAGSAPQAEEITWGVNFSQKHATALGLDWKESYSALLDDLKVRDLKVISHWDLLEPEKGKYDFGDLDWQIEKANEKGAKVILVVGMKTGRWPECHLPEWAKTESKEVQQQRVLKLTEELILRYQGFESIVAWQVENEPFFPFGECPWTDKEFVKKEISLVKSLDQKERPVMVSDSGELSFWMGTARLGDIVGTTLHRKVWFKELNNYVTYPLRPVFYWRKALIIKKLFGKEVICVELQAEPWGPSLLYNSPVKEQEKTMNLDQFQANIEFATKTGFDTFYLWGAEWWYWQKETQNNSKIWDEARKLWQD